jgi:hypothetical protein
VGGFKKDVKGIIGGSRIYDAQNVNDPSAPSLWQIANRFDKQELRALCEKSDFHVSGCF